MYGAEYQGMDFSEPSEAVQLKQAVDDFIEAEVAPLENKHEKFLGADYGFVRDDYDDALRTLTYDNARQVLEAAGGRVSALETDG